MRKICFTVFVFTLMCCLVSCASVPASDGGKKQSQQEEKILYDDWKYMGFGKEIPLWVDAALKNDSEKLKQLLPELSELNVITRTASGVNIDQAESSLLEAEIAEGFSVYDTFWVRENNPLNERPYIAVAIYISE